MPTNNPRLQKSIREALYSLKLDFGVPVIVNKITSSETNFLTGINETINTRTKVRRACLMPLEVTRGSYVSPFQSQTNKPFITKGAMGWDDAARLFLFDGRDLPNHVWALQDYIVHDYLRYEVVAFEEIGDKAGYAVWTSRAIGGTLQEVWRESVSHNLSILSEVINQ